MLELADHDSCQVAMLCAHFAESLDDACGHCTRCLNESAPRSMGERKPASIDPAIWTLAQDVRREHTQVLADERVFARFLCGLSSPALSRAKLTSDEHFGVLTHVPFKDVMQHIEADG